MKIHAGDGGEQHFTTAFCNPEGYRVPGASKLPHPPNLGQPRNTRKTKNKNRKLSNLGGWSPSRLLFNFN